MQEICLLGVEHWFMCRTDVAWAAWAQAIGTLAAILFAYWRGQRQHRSDVNREAAREASTRRDIISPFRGLLEKINDETNKIIESARQGANETGSGDALNSLAGR